MTHKNQTSERSLHTTLLSVASIILILTMIATLAHSGEVELKWNSVAEADGYKVYYGSASRAYQPPEEVMGQSQTTHTLTLDPGTYYFAVTAYNNYGESGYSEEIGPTIITASAPPPSSISLTPDLPSPQPEGTRVTFTAALNGGSGSYEYSFRIRNAVNGQWSTAQDYSSLTTYTWNATDTVDLISVWGRNVESEAPYQVKDSIQFSTDMDAPTSVTLRSDIPSPQPEGTTVRFTAQLNGGSGSYEYRFWTRNLVNGQWSIAQDYSSLATYTWNATATIDLICVWARNEGSKARYQVKDSIRFRTGLYAPRSVSLSSDLPSPQPEGTTVTFTAQAEGGSGSYEYLFWTRNPRGQWSLARDYSPDPNFTWTATDSVKRIVVCARKTGSKAHYQAHKSVRFSTDMYAPTSVSLTSKHTGPQTEGTTVTFTAQATGGSGNYQYMFWQYSQNSGWTMLRGYSASPICTWKATGGFNAILVYAKNTDSTDPYQVYETIRFKSE